MTEFAEVFVSHNREGQATLNQAIQYSLLFALIVLLPGLQGALFGWMHFLVPVTVLVYLYRWQLGFRFILVGLAISALASSIFGSFTLTVFSAALVPAGYVMTQSAFQGESPIRSGLKGALTLCLCWLLLLVGQTMLSGVNPISQSLGSLNQEIEQTLKYYRENNSVSADTLSLIEQSFYQTKAVLPKIVPAIMVSLSLLIVWGTMLAGNRLVSILTKYQPWPDQHTWRLPDRLILLFIGTAIAALLPLGIVRLIGVNGFICFSLIYFFQGFAILCFFLHKWKVPPLLRFLLYGMMLFQSFGTVLLVIVGISDVWLDLRRLKNQD